MALSDADNEKYLEDFDKQPDVHKTSSGLRYRKIKDGEPGGKSPKASDSVTVHYKGTFIDGREFDSSFKRNAPATFPLRAVISGWTEGVQLMKEGETFEFVLPYDLAYGERGGGSIPPRQTLNFIVELIKVV